MNRPYARLSFAATLLLAAAFAPRAAAAATTLNGGNLGNQTWTPAGSPYIVGGDITVQAGATLTIQAGTDVQFLTGDMQASGIDASMTELTVNGTLTIAGTTASPVTFEMKSGQTGNWYGIVIGAGAAGATITGASLHDFHSAAIGSTMTGTALSVTRTTIQGNGVAGIYVSGGSATLDQLSILSGSSGSTMSYGVEVTNSGSTATQIDLTNTLIVGCTIGASLIGPGGITANLSSLTIDGTAYGIDVSGGSQVVTVRNTIITNSSATAVSAPFGTTTLTYSDVWNSAMDLGVTPGAGFISANPQYVGATNYHLQASSVCIDTGTATGAPDHDLDGTARPLDGDGINGAAYDMGAYEYNPGGGAGGAGGTSATGTGGVAGTSGAAGASGSGGTAGAAGKGGNGAAGGGGAAGSGGAAGTVGAAGAGGTGGIAGTSGAAGAGAAGAGGIGGAVSGGSGGSATGAGGIGGATAMGSAGRTGTGGASSGPGGAAGGSTETGGSSGSSGGGCGCQTGGRPVSTWGLALVAAALLMRRRRRGNRV